MVRQDMLFIVLQRKVPDILRLLRIYKRIYCKIYRYKTAKKGKKYYYKVRAVKANEAGVDVFSAYSAAKAVKVK